MNQHLEQIADALFSSESVRIGNVKFFQGSRRDVKASDLAGQLRSADEQIARRTATRVEDVDGD